MDIDRILAPLRARPFSIVTSSGETHLVTTPENLAVDPEGYDWGFAIRSATALI
jgi:hypothetical protein